MFTYIYKLHCISQIQQTLLLYYSFLGNIFQLQSRHLQALQELDPRQNELKHALWDLQRLHYENSQHSWQFT